MTTLRIASLAALRGLFAAALVAIGAAAATPACAAPPAPGLSPSLGAWRSIPVLEDGRIMPLDTFARRHVETICHVQEPKLAVVTGEPLLKWHADELLLDWLVRPAAWEDVPFLIAEHEELRKLLGLELFADTPKGRVRLKYAAPSDVADSEPLRQRLIDLDGRRTEAIKEGRQFRAEGVDAKVEQLWQAYVTWRQLVFRAADDAVGRTRFLRTFEQLVTTWKPLREKLPQSLATDVDGALQGLAEVMGNSTRFPTADVLPRLTTLRQSIDALAVAGDAPADIRRGVRRLGDRLSALGEALYDNGGSLHVVPALHADELIKRAEVQGATVQMRVVGPGFDQIPGFELDVAAPKPLAIDLAKLKIPPGDHAFALVTSAVTKYVPVVAGQATPPAPTDIAEILVSTPIHVRVTPAAKEATP